MTANEIILKIGSTEELSEQAFYDLIKYFQSSYLLEQNYNERLSIHRQPDSFQYEVLNELHQLLMKIQHRPEMRHYDLEKNSSGYVPSEIIEIWRADKRLKSLYNSTSRYCFLNKKEFLKIAVHIAEYRGMNKLASKIQRAIYKTKSPSPSQSLNQLKETKKRASIPYKIKVALLKEVNNHCPFCGNEDTEHLQAHHIDNDRTHKKPELLIMVCGNCHLKIGNGDISENSVIELKQKLLAGKRITTTTNNRIGVNAQVANISTGDSTKIIIKSTGKKIIQKYPPGCIGFEVEKANYVSYLIKRYHEFKEWEVCKEKMNYSILNKNLKRQFKLGNQRTIFHLPSEKFEDLTQCIQANINKTKLAKTKDASHQNYSSFSEYQLQRN